MKQVLVITYYWPPSGGPGVQRWLKFVKYMPASGIRPVVLTVDPAQAEYPVLDPTLQADIAPQLQVYRTDCKGVYNLYKKLTGTRTAPYSGFANEGKPGILQRVARFIRGNFFLPDGRRGWVKYAYAEACRIIEKNGIDTVITTGPPHSTHFTGLKLKERYRIKWIADFRDPWTNIQYKSLLYQTAAAKRADMKYERRVLEHCDILTLAVDERERLQKIHPGADPKKMFFLPNGYDETDFAGLTPSNPDRFVITYTGTVAANYPVDGFIRALMKVRGQMPFTVRFVGKVDGRTRSELKCRLGENVEFIDFVEHRASILHLMSSSMLLLINIRVDGARYILHGKIFEYLASGKPVLLLGATDGISAGIIRQTGAGEAFDWDDADGIARFIIQQQKMQASGTPHISNHTAIRQFSREQLTRQLAEIIG